MTKETGNERTGGSGFGALWGYIAPMLAPISSQAQYAQAVDWLDSVLDEGGADETNKVLKSSHRYLLAALCKPTR